MTIAKDRNATKENYKTMFESYANEWGSQATSYMSYVLLYGDTHSANKVRVNAILSSTNEFYETYNIKENDKMFVSEQNRVKVW
jgi:putative endopeptidase